ncbi:hypothetical protein INR77_13735 [Erythrobacter sp. SCSIO 43205]|uniref:hypothetical protein n=1 Tax=Erythrobacter sp. SCSIO 43205 TaxID=2779361 RepID=UPI001CA92C9A|nr:hypothetical protein [Erythrobacter sp. SCSIO 43205]UAB77823.1 hypothetical protein INR77_13735 [Erythrobacter sp. SCSIO 43205]
MPNPFDTSQYSASAGELELLSRNHYDDWLMDRALVLQALDRSLKTKSPWVLGKGVAYQKAVSLSRRARHSIAMKSIGRGHIIDALKLAFLGEFPSRSASIAIKLGNRLANRGYYEEAILFFGSGIHFAKNKADCGEAIFQLGHCAKIAGYYSLAAECFTFVSSANEYPSLDSTEAKFELIQALHCLSATFHLS